jgi:uncharacterized SAM-binding protein YcdF (DUF218 family)
MLRSWGISNLLECQQIIKFGVLVSVYLLKLASWVLYPLSWVLLLLILSLVLSLFHRRLFSRTIFVLALVLLWVAAMPVTGQYALQSLERQYPMQAMDAMTTADAIVLLGGGMGGDAPPERLHPDLGDAADRVWYAAQLYLASKAPVIIASGGVIGWKGEVQTEAAAMRQLLEALSVPSQAIVDEGLSLTTFENAINSGVILDQRSVQRVLLVTSASHMPRALRVFQQQLPDIVFMPATTDVRALPLEASLLNWLPSASGLARTTEAWHEWVGYAMYVMKGWI